MKCLICGHGDTQPQTTTVTLERAGLVFVVRDVPAEVCANCGEAYVDEETTTQLLRGAEEAARAGAQVEVRRYVAA